MSSADRRLFLRGGIVFVAILLLAPVAFAQSGAVPCPAPQPTDPYQELRGLLAQLRSAETSDELARQPGVKALTGQLEGLLAARDAALQQGSCGTTPYDAHIAALASRLDDIVSGAGPAPTSPAAAGVAVAAPADSSTPMAQPPTSASAPTDSASRLIGILEKFADAAAARLAASGSAAGTSAAALTEGSGTVSSGSPDGRSSPGGAGNTGAGSVGTGGPASSGAGGGRIDRGRFVAPSFKQAPVSSGVNRMPPPRHVAVLTPGNIAGRVLNEQGRPLRGAIVMVDNVVSARTDEHGAFSFRNLKPGQYRVSASLPAYRPDSRAVDLTPGESETLSFTLRAAAVRDFRR